jgi:hypothetical protein
VRALLISLLVVATAACGAYRFPGETTPGGGTGTVSGQVTAAPCYPVQPANPVNCARPVGGLEIDFSGNRTTVGTTTDPKGFYSVALAAGSWKVSLKSYMRIISGPPVVTVTAGSNVVANYVVDSGIRVPVAKEPSTNPHPPIGGSAPGEA